MIQNASFFKFPIHHLPDLLTIVLIVLPRRVHALNYFRNPNLAPPVLHYSFMPQLAGVHTCPRQLKYGWAHKMDIPCHNRAILCLTSLWMAIPITFGGPLLLTEVLGLVCAASTLYWRYPNKWTQIIDKSLATVFLVLLTLHSLVHIYLTIFFIILVLYFYCLANYYYDLKKYTEHLMSHLMFRYTFYWWTHKVMLGHVDYFLLQSALYVISIVII